MSITFKSLTEPARGNNLLIIDSLNLAFRWKHQGKTVFVDEYLATVQSLAKSYNCEKIIIAADQGSSSYRKTLYPEYKQNRQELRNAQTPEERDQFLEFIEEYERVLLSFPSAPVLRYRGVEADDIAAYLASNSRKYGVAHVWLISSDKDWDLLVNEHTSRFSYVTRKEVTLDNWPYDVDPEHYISYKALMGDTGDNIPGIPGIGPKRASSLIKEHGSAMDIYDMCPINSKYKYIQSLNTHCERILLNFSLMDLTSYCEEAIGPENLAHIDSTVSEYLIADKLRKG